MTVLIVIRRLDPFEYLAYIFQEDMWYIIPAELVVGQGSVALYPKLKDAKYGPYKEAWRLLRKGTPAVQRRFDLMACVEPEESARESWMGRAWRRVLGG